ncbi:TetR/AcrR family transcriptional regulator [Mycobacterium sherrisii]|uniref:HTH tetR-type domain-containing protein n=1 Tax=Mycobacterium sherrisii TaxID=243061 RepID=A0A1E3SNM0_9MYCO|nr:TetR/AcrR family transcriptional regulator [Mycobacterium sherrisii]MCV7029098.1 TetR/AcrR family transcriptional regulator [Mycobacterium sherrisii]MEC4761973.1 TetR/AcrR family transcriptional regulator [Mycobacterium sherrisii]ODR03741.1 hypothetical protein BHQ21_20300 [Mycobacterium sherrisii]ORW75521.1 hypothetical protein AWC25_13870 [Mycobacterium sherrisii]
MRYPADHKAKARAALLRAGTQSMKVAGFHGIGVDGLAAAADVTSGAFYSNFTNKEAMLQAIVDASLGEPFVSDTAQDSKSEGRNKLKGFVAEYLSVHHLDHPADGCVMPTLSADVARAGTATRAVYERKITRMAERVAELLDGADRERRAWSIVALMVGAVSIARAMPDTGPRAGVLEDARKTIDQLISPVRQRN